MSCKCFGCTDPLGLDPCVANKQAYAGLLERLLESCIDWTGEPIVDGSTPRYELSCGDIREAAEAISSLLKALTKARGVISGLECQFDHQGCTCTFPSDDCCSYAKIDAALVEIDAALNSDAPLSIGEAGE